jgi:hypothetical protein
MHKGALADRMLQYILSLPDTITFTLTHSNTLQDDYHETEIFMLHQNTYQHVEVPKHIMKDVYLQKHLNK